MSDKYAALKQAAEKATPGEWCHGEHHEVIADAGLNANYYVASCSGPEHRANTKFIAAANPATILELLAERDADKRRIIELSQKCENDPLLHEVIDLKERIAELEAREIKPAKGEVLVTVTGFTGCGKSAIAGEIEIAMKAIGVPVQWTNGDAEKRTTCADWLTAIEMYKPRVRIVEVNLPRAAGFSLKIEGD
ncbi:ead/Ea22-like family protein [Pseudescherichia vulneris]|uniref:ead/Ea22-like family protein n=1 Tax=Pseudescherichia vulneris TaxID=566 RepID=UPI00227D2DFF|nr:ead/Ea22-like family protein [Pseudescherichia vulneris]WAH52586.1 ead/Ea22-like family protein [Pseudescherichia vulneris]